MREFERHERSPESPSTAFALAHIVHGTVAAQLWLRRWLGGRFLPYQLAVAAALLLSPTVTSGLYLDDFAQRLAVEHPELVTALPLRSVRRHLAAAGTPFKLKELGVDFRWIGPDTKVAYWRPLSALTHVFDYSVWPRWAWLMHLENFVWYAALIVACAALYRRFVPVAWVAGLAVDLYAFDPSHAGPVAWIANRNALMSTLFGVLALLAHDAWRSGGRRTFAFAAPALLLLALLSAESGVAIAGYSSPTRCVSIGRSEQGACSRWLQQRLSS